MTGMQTSLLTKKTLSQRVNLSRQTINEWIDKGILVPADTTTRGHALFTESQADRIREVLRLHPKRPSYHAGVIAANA